jgi:hypothetical protein
VPENISPLLCLGGTGERRLPEKRSPTRRHPSRHNITSLEFLKYRGVAFGLQDRYCDSRKRLQSILMELDTVVTEMEKSMLPELQWRHDVLNMDTRFSDLRLGSIRHHENLHAIALACHPMAAPGEHDGYHIGVNIISHNGMFMRGFVTWSQTFHCVPIKTPSGEITGYRRLSGYTIHEGMTRSFTLQPDGRLEDFFALLPALYRAFDPGFRRGHPPGAIRKLWTRFTTGEIIEQR